MTDKYLSVEDYATFLGVTPTESTSPTLAQVQQYITLAESEFDSKVGDFSIQTDDVEIVKAKKFQNNGGIYYPAGHITSIKLLEVSDGDVFDPTWTVIDNSPTVNYVIDNPLSGKILIRNYILKREYRATVDKGYALVDVPSNMKWAVYAMTQKRAFQNHLFKNNVSDNVTRIIDIDVYKEITKGGNPFEGLGAIDVIISDSLSSIKGNMRTSIGW